jgi:hypothetical protein
LYKSLGKYACSTQANKVHHNNAFTFAYFEFFFPGKMAFTLGFLSLFGFLGVTVPLIDDSDKLLFGLAGSSGSLISTGVSGSPSMDLSATSAMD